MLKNLSNFNNVADYLPIFTAALLVDMVVIVQVVFRYIRFKSLDAWYNEFGFLAVLADVLSITIGIIIARALYPLLFSEYYLFAFLSLTVAVQMTHDLLFAKLFYSIPKGLSRILDVFKSYGTEVGAQILLADASMMVFTILVASYLANFTLNTQIIVLIAALYILPYLLYSIPK
jgi:hypothetical protein